MADYGAAPNSSFRGFLRPGTGAPFSFDEPLLGLDQGLINGSPTLQGQNLDDFMQEIVSGITGIDGTLVFPRWQGEPPDLTQTAYNEAGVAGVNCWAAVGVIKNQPIGYSFNKELAAGSASAGYQQVSDWEEFDCLCSFYGPFADQYASFLRRGLMVDQNREPFQLTNMGLRQTSGLTVVPSLVKGRWLRRVDMTLYMTREVRDFYPVLTLLAGTAAITTDTGVTDVVTATIGKLIIGQQQVSLPITIPSPTGGPGYFLFEDSQGNLAIRAPDGDVTILVLAG